MVFLPNLISLSRLLSVPIVIWLITIGRFEIAFWLFLISGVSDAVDGFIAKRWHVTTELGRILDPVADKTLLVSIYVAFGINDYLPSWIVILVVSRDVLIVGAFLISLLLGQEVRVRPLRVSKINTAMQLVLATFILASGAFTFSFPEVERGLTYMVGITTVVSGATYLSRWIKHLTEPLGME